jgi:hypothetical protein
VQRFYLRFDFERDPHERRHFAFALEKRCHRKHTNAAGANSIKIQGPLVYLTLHKIVRLELALDLSAQVRRQFHYEQRQQVVLAIGERMATAQEACYPRTEGAFHDSFLSP